MQHKGLVYTITGIVIIAIMSAIIAFSMRSSEVRTIFIDSYPSGTYVMLDGVRIGETPLAINRDVFKKYGYDIDNYALARIFTHELSYVELAAPEVIEGKDKPTKVKRGRITFMTKPASKSVPQVFDGNAPLNEFEPMARDIELLMRLPDENRIIAVFNRELLPNIGLDRKMRADVTVYALPLQDAGVSMSDFNSCKVKNSSEFRKKKQ